MQPTTHWLRAVLNLDPHKVVREQSVAELALCLRKRISIDQQEEALYRLTSHPVSHTHRTFAGLNSSTVQW